MVAVLLQLLTVVILSHLLRGMRTMIEAGQVAALKKIVRLLCRRFVRLREGMTRGGDF